MPRLAIFLHPGLQMPASCAISAFAARFGRCWPSASALIIALLALGLVCAPDPVLARAIGAAGDHRHGAAAPGPDLQAGQETDRQVGHEAGHEAGAAGAPELPIAEALRLLCADQAPQKPGPQPQPQPHAGLPTRPTLALMGTIPLYWGEADGLAELLAGTQRTHWARPLLEACYHVAPLDYLSAPALEGHRRLLLAQPRGLTAEENVALDAWVRAGGRLLLFADPLMTGESRYGFGDRRRPQDTALLSPILAHWGLAMQFAPQEGDPLPDLREIAGNPVPVEQAGRFVPIADGKTCAFDAAGLLAKCHIEQGFVLMMADAALLNLYHAPQGSASALARLAAQVFALPGD